MVLLGEVKASFLESLTVELTSVLENLADRVNADVLRKDLLATSLDRLNVVAISQLQKITVVIKLKGARLNTYLHDIKDVLAVNLCAIRVDMAQETHELFVGDVAA